MSSTRAEPIHYGYKPYPKELASITAWGKRGRRIKEGEQPRATATLRQNGTGNRQYRLFHFGQTISKPVPQDYDPDVVLQRCRDPNSPCPSGHLSEVDADARQVILANVSGELARYRIGKGGSLRQITEVKS